MRTRGLVERPHSAEPAIDLVAAARTSARVWQVSGHDPAALPARRDPSAS